MIKNYAWIARDYQGKPLLALQLLQAAFEMAQKELPEYSNLHNQLRRDIADLNHVFGDSEKAKEELLKIDYGFSAGDILLEQGRFDEALKIYEVYHATGRFRIHWRLWRCSFLLNRFKDVLSYIDQYNSEIPNRLVTNLEARALAVATVASYDHFKEEDSWQAFNIDFPNCASILKSKIGDLESIVSVAKRWMIASQFDRLRKRLIGKPKRKEITKDPDSIRIELDAILEKARNGIWDVPPIFVETATSILKKIALDNAKLDGRTTIEYMAKGFVHPIILESHQNSFCDIVDLKLGEFEKVNGIDLVSMYREKILGSFGFFDDNEVSTSIKAIILSAEAEIREANGLPQRGEGWLIESEMVRLLSQKFAPFEVIRQHSPDWLQGMRFDAYIPKFLLAVEYQGEQHFKPIDIFGGDDGFSQTIMRDELKRSLSKENGINLEDIAYNQDIDQETTRLAKKYYV